ncbi:hypothetical protein GPJ56_000305 [Histomonas meleagridis]|uniref:uncharacterized protein n=1 Tax=Histomonas meleagridis TaxID=135588 RepID=UPI00355A828C|nr:hypothetical protein GPJ56_000305 [Histomonas meleagridis]KAH0806823.1 hypothetical protein GO595_000466 [Histomonas meleagridis]
MTALFDKWTIQIKNAIELEWIPQDCVDSISCVRFGIDQVAFGSSRMNAIIHSKLSQPNAQRFSLPQNGSHDSIIDLQWSPVSLNLLLVVSEKQLTIIDTDTNSLITQIPSPNSSVPFLNAFFLLNGGIIALLEQNAVAFYSENYERADLVSVKGKCTCAAIDGNVFYIGQYRHMRVFDINEFKLEKRAKFIVHPKEVQRIQILSNLILISAEGGLIAWTKDTYIPLFRVKADKHTFIVDDRGELAVNAVKGKTVAMVRVQRGKAREMSQIIPTKSSTESLISADWYQINDNESYCAIAFENSDEFCLVNVVKVTRHD